MLLKLSTNKTVSEVTDALQAAVQANHFGVMQVQNLKETMAKNILDQDMSVSTALPCRISI